MQIRRIAIDKLNPAAYNPRIDLKPGDPEYDKLANSIDAFGYIEPIIWNERTGNVVGGHQRLKILKERGETEVQVVVVDYDETTEMAANVALNKISGDWDMPKLKDVLEHLDTGAFDMELTGFDETELERLMSQFHVDGEVTEDDFDADAEAEKIAEPVTKRGDVWLLGEHRLMCGDSTSATDVERLMGGDTPQCMWTDPPYGVSYVGKTKDALTIEGDDAGGLEQLLADALGNAFTLLTPGAPVYIARPPGALSVTFGNAILGAGFHIHEELQWVKDSMVLGHSDYHLKHETVVYGWKPGAQRPWYSGRSEVSVFDIPRPKVSSEHPTGKPVKLISEHLTNSTRQHDMVYEPFSGSGTTIIAAEQLSRKCYAMEISERYCDVAVKRWEQFTGKTAELAPPTALQK